MRTAAPGASRGYPYGGTAYAKSDAVTQLANGVSTTTFRYDQNGGSANVTSDSSTNVAQWFDYAPYGSVVATTNTGQTSAGRQFEGLFNDATNLVYSNARYLNPAQGQFTTEDPVFWAQQNISDPQSMNSYSYAEDNPIVKSDPSGKFSPAFALPFLFVPELSIPAAALLYGGAAISGIVAGSAIYNAYNNSAQGAPGSGPLQESMVQNSYSTDFQMGGPTGKPPGQWGPLIIPFPYQHDLAM